MDIRINFLIEPLINHFTYIIDIQILYFTKKVLIIQHPLQIVPILTLLNYYGHTLQCELH